MIHTRQNLKIFRGIFQTELDDNSHVTDVRKAQCNETAFMELFLFSVSYCAQLSLQNFLTVKTFEMLYCACDGPINQDKYFGAGIIVFHKFFYESISEKLLFQILSYCERHGTKWSSSGSSYQAPDYFYVQE